MLPMPKDNSLFIPLETENFLFLVQRVFFGFSVCLHIPALFCLIKETPAHQAQIKPNLILVQVNLSHFGIFAFPYLFFSLRPHSAFMQIWYRDLNSSYEDNFHYLISTVWFQIAVIVIDLFDTIFFEIVPIAEAFLGYCKGLLCRVLQPTVVSVSTSFIFPFILYRNWYDLGFFYICSARSTDTMRKTEYFCTLKIAWNRYFLVLQG